MVVATGQGCHGLVQRGAGEVDGADLGPGLRQGAGRRPADTARGAGDHHTRALEPRTEQRGRHESA